MFKKNRLGDLLVSHKLISPAQLQEALAYQQQEGIFLGEAIVSLGMLPASLLGGYMQELTTYPFVELASTHINPALAHALPEAYVRQKMLLPFAEKDEGVCVAMLKPLDLALVDDVRSRLGRRVLPHLAFRADLSEAIDRVSWGQERVQSVLAEMSGSAVENDLSVDELLIQAEEAPIVRLVNGLLQSAVRSGASDIHIEPQEQGVRVRFREDGLLYEQTMFTRQHLPAVISRIKIMSGLNISERRKPQDGQMRFQSGESDVDLRVSLLPQVYGESIVMRVLDKRAALRSLQDMGMEPELHNQARALLAQPHGILLVTGPTGSGKTTTLYAMLNALNDNERKIITVEDPVEYHLPGINQVQVNPHVGLTFANGLRSIVRQDPDVILVGEIRDRETAEVAIQAAMTGHIVLSTLHTNDAPGAIVRLQNMGVEPFLIASAIIGVLAQRLVRTICPHCKETYAPPPATLRALGAETSLVVRAHAADARARLFPLRQPGMRGRTAVYELMPMSAQLSDMSLRGCSGRQLREQAVSEGMISMREYAIRQALKGLTTFEEISRVLSHTQDMETAV